MINIVFGLDDAYSKFCAVTIASILTHHKQTSPQDKIHFFFLAGNISGENQKKLLELRDIQDFDYTFINNIDNSIFKDIPIIGWNNYALCYRLLIPEILPDDVKKAIYLDCDIIVNIDIKDLWDIDIENYLLAAVSMNASTKHEGFEDSYFNSGVIVFNNCALREFNFEKKWRDYAANLPKETVLTFPDQDVLNYTVGKNALLLPQKYNIIDENIGNAKGIIHYAGRKPWGILCAHPLKNLYFKYAKMTPYKKDFRFIRMRSFFKMISKNPFFFFKKHYLRIIKNFILLKIGFIKNSNSVD
ncbi:MAG: glycosyltransferase family 8 protein [Elusimicrobiota bacterium]|jgi:lipopolysaccharide biosynthesis glycosyltransferase|nr:glycosyltransferase family 8 protein [Elusimicrobiota bacterium]